MKTLENPLKLNTSVRENSVEVLLPLDSVFRVLKYQKDNKNLVWKIEIEDSAGNLYLFDNYHDKDACNADFRRIGEFLFNNRIVM